MSKKPKTRNNRKAKKINKKRLLILLFIFFIFIFGATKAVNMTLSSVSNIISKDEKSDLKDTQQKEDNKINDDKPKEQFDLEDEENKLSSKFIVLVDASHGGDDSGTKGISKTKEKDITIEIAKKVASNLSKYSDIQVLMSRTEDTNMSLKERAKLAQEQNVDLLISVHANAEYGGNTASGIETFYDPEGQSGSKELATLVQNTAISYVGARDRGVKQTSYEIVSQVDMPAALIECGFITNKEEEKKLLDPKYQQELSEGISQGVLSYIDKFISKE